MKAQDSGSIAVLAEKPSVARDVARTLGATQTGEGYLHGNGYVVTWAIGHLVALPEPHEIDPSWRQWRRNTLPARSFSRSASNGRLYTTMLPVVPRTFRSDSRNRGRGSLASAMG
jgi:DNA topoisomerase IA